MALFDKARVGEDGYLMQIGTLSGNPVAAAAGLATLAILKRPGAYESVFATGRTLMDGIGRMLQEAGLPAQVIGAPPLFDVVFSAGDLSDYRSLQRADAAMAARFNRRLREAGVLKGESKIYVSLAHDEADVGHMLSAVEQAVKAARGQS